MTLGLGLVPIVPILLLPFILVVFVVVFPLWLVGLGVVGLLLAILMGMNALALAMNIHFLEAPTRAIRIAFRWVLTFGGLAKSREEREAESSTAGIARR